MAIIYAPADGQLERDFVRLETLLKANPLPDSGAEGGYRVGRPGEFMWMYEDSEAGVGFKHSLTRRYVRIVKRAGVDVLILDGDDYPDWDV